MKAASATTGATTTMVATIVSISFPWFSCLRFASAWLDYNIKKLNKTRENNKSP